MVEVEVNDAADTELLMQVSASFVVTALYAVLIHDLQLNHAAYQLVGFMLCPSSFASIRGQINHTERPPRASLGLLACKCGSCANSSEAQTPLVSNCC